MTIEKNWAGNQTYQATQWHTPSTIEDVQAVIRQSEKIKGLGSRHSFNTIADSQETMISMKAMDRVVELDTDNHTVTVEGGVTYGALASYLNEQGFALHNLASLPHISVVGACMTGTHGSGENNGNLATSVRAIQLVTGDGEVIERHRDDHGDEFAGMVVSLGALGIITRITLDIVPTYDIRQDVYLDMPFDDMFANFDEIQASAYSVSLFTKWQDNLVTQTWVKSTVDMPFILGDDFYGGRSATLACSPVGDDRTARCTEQMGVSGAWHDRLPHFRMEFTPSHGDEIQSEFFVARSNAIEAIQAVNTLHEVISPILHVTEIRTIKGDDLWLSPAYGQDSVALHFTWKPEWDALQPVLQQVEAVLMPFNARPHWGKVFMMPADYVQAQYNKLDDFRALMHKYDPQGKFQNPFLRDYLL